METIWEMHKKEDMQSERAKATRDATHSQNLACSPSSSMEIGPVKAMCQVYISMHAYIHTNINTYIHTYINKYIDMYIY